jgi:DNA-binding SARP family transcriptional activator
MSDFYLELAKQQLQESQARLIVIHPNYQYQRHVLWNFMSLPDSIYVRFTGTNLNTAEAQQQIDGAVDTSVVGLESANTLILDECDRIELDALDTLMENAVETMFGREGTRIVVISRIVPRFVWKQVDYRARMALIPVDEELLLCDYIRDDEAPALLEVHAFGRGRVLLNGVEITQWDGHLPRSLFFYVVDRGMTTRNDIFEVFWPDLPVREATNVFHVTKRKISEVLGVDLTAYWSGFYRISPDIELNYDAMQFSRLVQDSSIAPDDEAQRLLSRAISLYRGEFLTSLSLPWVEKRRSALVQTYGEALVSLARISQDSGEIQRALGFYLRSTMTNPQREDLVQQIMVLYDKLEMHQDALVVYERLVQELSSSLNVAPAPQVRDLAETIRAKL